MSPRILDLGMRADDPSAFFEFKAQAGFYRIVIARDGLSLRVEWRADLDSEWDLFQGLRWG